MSAHSCSNCRDNDFYPKPWCKDCRQPDKSLKFWQPSYAALFQRLKEAESIMFSVHKLCGLTNRDDVCQIMRPYSTSYPIALIKEVTYVDGTIPADSSDSEKR